MSSPAAVVRAHFILFVSDQSASTRFYADVLGCPPSLEVPGMSEIDLGGGAVLGLMPLAGIRRLLGPGLLSPQAQTAAPRCELYLVVDDVQRRHADALRAGALEVSAPATRDWGHVVGYWLDLDRHLVALAEDPSRPR